MKIDFKNLVENNFNINLSSSKRVKTPFEDYLKVALAQLKEEKISSKEHSGKLKEIFQKLETSLNLLETSFRYVLDVSSSETLGDFLLGQALELDKILEILPEDSIKFLLKEIVFFIGIEAQKIKEGYYS